MVSGKHRVLVRPFAWSWISQLAKPLSSLALMIANGEEVKIGVPFDGGVIKASCCHGREKVKPLVLRRRNIIVSRPSVVYR